MERKEFIWFTILLIIALSFNVITLTPLVPWQRWLLWSEPVPEESYLIEFGDNEITLPDREIEIKAGQYVEFVATSEDVTYGFGVFDPDGPMLFQMQVLPGRENRIIWKFDSAGVYDVRSTEYSGPKHSDMFIEDAIRIVN